MSYAFPPSVIIGWKFKERLLLLYCFCLPTGFPCGPSSPSWVPCPSACFLSASYDPSPSGIAAYFHHCVALGRSFASRGFFTRFRCFLLPSWREGTFTLWVTSLMMTVFFLWGSVDSFQPHTAPLLVFCYYVAVKRWSLLQLYGFHALCLFSRR